MPTVRLVNPHRRPARKSTKKRAHRRRSRSNPLAELVLMGANPMKRARKQYHRRRKTHNPAHARRRRHNPVRLHASGRRYHRRRNPMSLAIAPRDLLPTVAGAIGGGVISTVVPQTLAPSYDSGFVGAGLSAAVAIGGSMAVEKFLGKNVGLGFLLGGLTAAGGKLIAVLLGKQLVTYASPLSGLGLYEKSYFAVPTVSSGALQTTPFPVAAVQVTKGGVSGLGAYNRRFASRFAA